MNEWMNICMNIQSSGNESITLYVEKKKVLKEWWLDEWMNEWMNECMNEWMNEWMTNLVLMNQLPCI